jgi:hypothetical protein
MVQRYVVAAGLLGAALVLVTRAPAELRQTLRPSNTLPPISSQTLSGKQLDLPPVSGSGMAVAIFSFSRAGGRDAQKWAQSLSKEEPQVMVYTVINLESVPGLFRTMAVSAIRDGMPLSMRDRTVILYRDENLWKQRLQIVDESRACVILLEPGGHIKWLTTGPFTESLSQALREQLRGSN